MLDAIAREADRADEEGFSRSLAVGAILVGDRIRVSDLVSGPRIVEVVGVRLESDGVKTVVVKALRDDK